MTIENIMHEAWGKTLREAAKAAIRKEIGHGLDHDVHKAIQEAAVKLIETDPEIQTMLREAVKSWISTQTADDVRRARDEAHKKYGR